VIPSLTEMTAIAPSSILASSPNALTRPSPFPNLLGISQAGLAKTKPAEIQASPPFDGAVSDIAIQTEPIGVVALDFQIHTPEIGASIPAQNEPLGHSENLVRGPAPRIDPAPELRPAAARSGRDLPDSGSELPSEEFRHLLPTSTVRLEPITDRLPAAKNGEPQPANMGKIEPSISGTNAPDPGIAPRNIEQSNSRSGRDIIPPIIAGANPGGPVVERDTTHLPKHIAETDREPKSLIPDGRDVSRRLPKPAPQEDAISPSRSENPQPATNPVRAQQSASAIVAAPVSASATGNPVAPSTTNQGSNLPTPVLGNNLPQEPGFTAPSPDHVKTALIDDILVSRPEPKSVGAENPETRTKPELAASSLAPRILPALRENREHQERARTASVSSELPPLAPSNAQSPAAATPPASQPLASQNAPLSQVQATSSAPQLGQPTNDIRGDIRAGQAIASAIDQLTVAREAGRSARPELTMRHQEFGAINMRIEASGTELRATLVNRDPGFVPAVQAALAERAISAPNDSASAQSHTGRNGDQGERQNGVQNCSTQGNPFGSGGSSEGRYGSSTGSGQGPSQPYREQSGDNEERRAAKGQTGLPDLDDGSARDTGLFA